MRKAGILMPVASLPSRTGAGNFGPTAYHFIDLIDKAGLSIWQILPLNPTGFGNSPYQPYSSYAMDDLYISLEDLCERKLIRRAPRKNAMSEWVDYEGLRIFRERYLREAYRNFVPDEGYEEFVKQEWLESFALFMTFRRVNGNTSWTEWPENMRDYPINKEMDITPYETEYGYEVFKQYMVYVQWKAVKKYANDKGIEIMGDLPFYVGLDSADVWSNRKNFLLDSDGKPTFIAGVPPDYFSATGQRWGNPIYDWDYMKKDGFTFWLKRLSYSNSMMDIVRVDHFRAFDTFWKIPASCPTAVEGEWVEAPGYELFDTLFEKNPGLRIVAEDLGDLRPQVLELRDHYNFRGMRVIQFSFDPAGMEEDRTHLLVYTGTHDNDTVYSWYREHSQGEQKKMRRYLKHHGYTADSFVTNILEYSLDSHADMVIIPMCDWLHLPHSARLNTPGTVGAPNWMWHMKDYSAFVKKTVNIRKSVTRAGRCSKMVI